MDRDERPEPGFHMPEPAPVPLGVYGRLFVASLCQYHASSARDPFSSASWFMTVMTVLPIASGVCIVMGLLMWIEHRRLVFPFIHVAALVTLLLVFGFSQRIARRCRFEQHIGDVTLMESRWMMWRSVFLLLAVFVAAVVFLGVVASRLGPVSPD